MKKFNQRHPKTRREIRKVALQLLTDTQMLAKQGQLESPPKKVFPLLTTIELHSRQEGKVEQLVRVLDNRVLCALSSQPIVKPSMSEAMA